MKELMELIAKGFSNGWGKACGDRTSDAVANVFTSLVTELAYAKKWDELEILMATMNNTHALAIIEVLGCPKDILERIKNTDCTYVDDREYFGETYPKYLRRIKLLIEKDMLKTYTFVY